MHIAKRNRFIFTSLFITSQRNADFQKKKKPTEKQNWQIQKKNACDYVRRRGKEMEHRIGSTFKIQRNMSCKPNHIKKAVPCVTVCRAVYRFERNDDNSRTRRTFKPTNSKEKLVIKEYRKKNMWKIMWGESVHLCQSHFIHIKIAYLQNRVRW